MINMISIIYGGNQEGICFDIYQSILSQLDNNNIRNINLQYENISLTLPHGYHSQITEQQMELIESIHSSDTLIFIYPLYWFNMTPIMKSFIDQVFWPEYAFSFKEKQYFKKGLWKNKKAIIVYTQGGPEIFHKLNKRLGYQVLKYPLHLSGIYNIKTYHLDNLNRSKQQRHKITKRINNIAHQIAKQV